MTTTQRNCSLILMLSVLCPFSFAEPPFWGTIFIDPDIVTPEDETTFQELEFAGRGSRQMYDRRSGWVTLDAYLFDVQFSDGLSAEFQVNPEFGSASNAEEQVSRFVHAIGQLPTALRQDMETVWIHEGNNPFGGGNNNILIHTGQADAYIRDGILEETLIHEAAHTSLDAAHAKSDDWLAAQDADPDFISTYARDNPLREDVAESFLTYVAARHRPDRISADLLATIEEINPNRLDYFDEQQLDLFPIVPLATTCELSEGLLGDLDGDDQVDFSDFLVLADNFGAENVSYEEGDIDCSGSVDFGDFLKLASNFGRTAPVATVPEAEFSPLALIVGVCLLRLRLRHV